ncbi:EAL domain-containing protein [Acidiferrimicrobium sp. IK]|uniref:putative bifunctional diguanylate cyclase/phosphodiesterase n=1 Tax=Acidiferrimicrobium sp. IK TaxID=2871700 RepID=UPI0021CB6D4B|nr:EAL domain-containing protein [Acidiferrimicrobium sp. IK]MCU4183362.1 EAL domain-containing protein [Acidiferrimicrobium sp. IK]
MATDRELAEVLRDFARTMVTDFPIQSILDQLVHRIVDIMPVSAAGVTLISDGARPRYVAASDASALQFEQLQTELDDGLCIAAYMTGEAVAVPDLAGDTRFEKFKARALAEGLVSVWTFPLRQGDRRLGALDLYGQAPGVLDDAAMDVAETLADVTSAYLVNAQARADLEDSSAALAHRSLHDPLTGLPNRALLLDRLDRVLRSSGRSASRVAVLYVDLDRFKDVNDDHGHRVGDELLVAVATRLAGMLRPGDTLARMSGDEFVIVCEDLEDERQAEVIAARIVTSLAAPFALSGVEVTISASAGVAFAGPSTGLVPERLLHDADIAMYQAKRQGGHRHQVIDLRAAADAHDRHALGGDLVGAVGRGEMRLDYQPIVSAVDGRLAGVEALLRWDHARRGIVPPALVVPLAERAGLMVDIGRWVIQTACEDLNRWSLLPAGAAISVAVNVSALQLMHPAFVATVASVVEATGADPRRLTFEITEGILLQDSAPTGTVLSELKALGVNLALDDFGTGHSPLTYLRAFPVDVVKIDRAFVSNFLEDASSRAIIAKVIELAHLLDMTVVSEGVETSEQHDGLVSLGSDYCQGFYFARPMPAATLEALLHDPPGSSLRFPSR